MKSTIHSPRPTISAKPILFSAPMVRAILEGRKTQTRRALLFQPDPLSFGPCGVYTAAGLGGRLWCNLKYDKITRFVPCPYGKPGDRLWVREEFYQFGHWEIVPGAKTKGGRQKWKFVADNPEIRFDAPQQFRKGRHQKDPGTKAWHKRLARFMPRTASRTTLEVVGIQVERLQEISEEDAQAEGVEPLKHGFFKAYNCKEGFSTTAKRSFETLWQEINDDDSWDKNPLVWVLKFKRVEQEKTEETEVKG